MAVKESVKPELKTSTKALMALNILLYIFTLLEKTRLALTGLINIYYTSSKLTASMWRLQVLSVTLAGLHFVMVPLMYLEAFLTGRPIPFTLSNNAKWLYAAALFGLALTAILVPAIAFPLALTMASLVLTVGALSFVSTVYAKLKDTKSTSMASVANKFIGSTLSAVALVGIVVSFYIPPVGLTILLTASILTLSLITANIGHAVIQRIRRKKSPAEPIVVHESTSDLSKALQPDAPTEGLGKTLENEKIVDKFVNRLDNIISSASQVDMLTLMYEVASYVAHPNAPFNKQEVKTYFNERDDFNQEIKPLLKKALDAYARHELDFDEKKMVFLQNGIPEIKAYMMTKIDSSHAPTIALEETVLPSSLIEEKLMLKPHDA